MLAALASLVQGGRHELRALRLQPQRRAFADGQACFERHAPVDIRAESAGSSPARHVWPTVVEAMAEVGLDLSARKPRTLLREMQLHADWAQTTGCAPRTRRTAVPAAP